MRMLGKVTTLQDELKKGMKKNVDNRCADLANTLAFSKEDRETLKIALLYQKSKIRHLGANIFSFPFKLGDPRKVSTKVWKHFELMKNILKSYQLDPMEFIEFTFKKQVNNSSNLTPWFIYSDARINEFLNYKKKKEHPVSKEQVESLAFGTCDQLVKIYMAKRHCTEEQFWRECWMNNWVNNFPIEYLRQHTLYKKLYAEGAFKNYETCPNPFPVLKRGGRVL